MVNTNFLQEDTITISRVVSGGNYDSNGIWIPETRNTLQIQGCVQPLEMFVIDRAGNKRLQKKGCLVVYSEQELQVASENNTADIVIFQGKEYEVIEKSWWEGVTMSFWKYQCELLNNV
jgi:hypothetical protein